MGKLKKQKNKDSAHSFQRIETAWPNLVQRPWLNLVSHKPFKEMSDDENQRKMCSCVHVLGVYTGHSISRVSVGYWTLALL